jgi:desampylase
MYTLRRAEVDDAIRSATGLANDGGREICGLLLGRDCRLTLAQVRNKIRRGGGFAFYAAEVRALARHARAAGSPIVGTFHSHPLGLARPGPTDIEFALDDSLMLIIDVLDASLALWHIVGGKARRLRCRWE